MRNATTDASCGSGNDISACGILFGGVLPNVAYAFPLQPTFRRAYDRCQA